MAIQPTTRPSGSSHILRFQGGLRLSAVPSQTLNAEVPQSVTANTRTNVLFALADLTDLTDLTKQLPPRIFDDVEGTYSNTAAGGPSIPVPPLAGTPAGQSWEQNVKVRALEDVDSTISPNIARVDVLTPSAVRDGSGTTLVGASGIPVVAIAFFFTAAGVAVLESGQGNDIPVVVEIEIMHSLFR